MKLCRGRPRPRRPTTRRQCFGDRTAATSSAPPPLLARARQWQVARSHGPGPRTEPSLGQAMPGSGRRRAEPQANGLDSRGPGRSLQEPAARAGRAMAFHVDRRLPSRYPYRRTGPVAFARLQRARSTCNVAPRRVPQTVLRESFTFTPGPRPGLDSTETRSLQSGFLSLAGRYTDQVLVGLGGPPTGLQ